jgi:hypothetical protein
MRKFQSHEYRRKIRISENFEGPQRGASVAYQSLNDSFCFSRGMAGQISTACASRERPCSYIFISAKWSARLLTPGVGLRSAIIRSGSIAIFFKLQNKGFDPEKSAC